MEEIGRIEEMYQLKIEKNIFLKSVIYIFSGVIIFISPFLIMPIFLGLFNVFIPTVSQDEINSVTVFIGKYGLKFNEYIYNFILLLQIAITVVFSFVLWKTSSRSNALAEKIDKKDDVKENGLIRENALIVYYDLTLGIKDLTKLYNSRIVNNTNPNPKKLFFSNDWVKNVAFLKDKLSNIEISRIYSLYGDLWIIKNLLESNNSQNNFRDLDDEVERLFISIMNKNTIEYAYSFDINIFDAESYVNSFYFYILEKLRLLTYTEKQVSTEYVRGNYQQYIESELYYSGEMENGKFEGQGTIWSKNLKGKPYKKFEGKFVEGVFLEGFRQEEHPKGSTFFIMQFNKSDIRVSGQVFDIENKLLSDGRYDGNGNPQEGFFTLFYDKGKVRYIGEIKDSMYHGKGTLFENRVIKDGTWEKGRFIEGMEHNVRVADSEGYDYYAEQSYIEQKIQEMEAMPAEVEEALGARGWTEYASIQHKKGEASRIIKGTSKTEYEY